MGRIQTNIQFQKKNTHGIICVEHFDKHLVYGLNRSVWERKERSHNLGPMKIVEAFKHNRMFQPMGF
jgi:hypothetical protein